MPLSKCQSNFMPFSAADVERDAVFDASGQYRYVLWRRWHIDSRNASNASNASNAIAFVMLNPSTADHRQDDPTIRACMQFAQVWGYSTLAVVNLFAYRATQPQQLQQAAHPIGAENDRYLIDIGQAADQIVIAWGNWGCLQERDRTVLELLTPYAPLYCLGQNRTGQPRHPLYVSRRTELKPYPLPPCRCVESSSA
jgi:hypothetical protein